MAVIITSFTVSTVAALFLAYKITSKTSTRVIVKRANPKEKVEEITTLSTLLIDELKRFMGNDQPTPAEISNIHEGISFIIRSAWKLDSYYGHREVIPFLHTLDTALQFDTILATPDRRHTLIRIIEQATNHCVSLILRREDGDKVTDATYEGSRQLDASVDKLNLMLDNAIREVRR